MKKSSVDSFIAIPRHRLRERSDAIHTMFEKTGLLRRFAPRKDGVVGWVPRKDGVVGWALRKDGVVRWVPCKDGMVGLFLLKTRRRVGCFVMKSSVYSFIAIPRHRLRERSDAIHTMFEKTGLLRRFAPPKDGVVRWVPRKDGVVGWAPRKDGVVRWVPCKDGMVGLFLLKTRRRVGCFVMKSSVYSFIAIPRHRLRERSDAIHTMFEKTGLLRRFAPRKDGVVGWAPRKDGVVG